jgi:hypothetical protein
LHGPSGEVWLLTQSLVNADTMLAGPVIVHAPSSTLVSETLTVAAYCWVITLDVPLPSCVTLSLHERVIVPAGPPPGTAPDTPFAPLA